MISYDYSEHTQLDVATKDTERRMGYDNDFLRQCGIAPLPYLAFWMQYASTRHTMVVGINSTKKRPSLRIFVREDVVAEGQRPAWVLSKEIKVRKKVTA